MNGNLDFIDVSAKKFLDEFFLGRRLNRVSVEHITKFLKEELNSEIGEFDDKELQIERFLTFYRSTYNHKSNELKEKYFKFFRNYLLTSNRSEHILQIENLEDKESLINWIKTLSKEEGIKGQNHVFYMHEHHKLDELKIEFDEENESKGSIYLPTEALLMLSKDNKEKSIPNGYNIVKYNPTKEFEVIFRKDCKYIEVRGEYTIVKDFVSTCLKLVKNLFKDASSIFIGNKNPRTKKILGISKIKSDISIEELRKSLNGKYLKISSQVSGSSVVKISMVFDDQKNSEEETNIDFKNVYDKIVENPDTGSIFFSYNGNKVSFRITNKGGLNFVQYVPEDVITYVIYKIISLESKVKL